MGAKGGNRGNINKYKTTRLKLTDQQRGEQGMEYHNLSENPTNNSKEQRSQPWIERSKFL